MIPDYTILPHAMLETMDLSNDMMLGYPSMWNLRVRHENKSSPKSLPIYSAISTCKQESTALSQSVAALGALLLTARQQGEPDLLGLAMHVAPEYTTRLSQMAKPYLIKHLTSPVKAAAIIAAELLQTC